MRQDSWSTERGQASISWPDKMTPQDYAESAEFMELILRRIKRKSSENLTVTKLEVNNRVQWYDNYAMTGTVKDIAESKALVQWDRNRVGDLIWESDRNLKLISGGNK